MVTSKLVDGATRMIATNNNSAARTASVAMYEQLGRMPAVISLTSAHTLNVQILSHLHSSTVGSWHVMLSIGTALAAPAISVSTPLRVGTFATPYRCATTCAIPGPVMAAVLVETKVPGSMATILGRMTGLLVVSTNAAFPFLATRHLAWQCISIFFQCAHIAVLTTYAVGVPHASIRGTSVAVTGVQREARVPVVSRLIAWIVATSGGLHKRWWRSAVPRQSGARLHGFRT